MIITLYNQIGSSWKRISKELPGRPENAVKNRFYSHIKRFYHLESTVREAKQESEHGRDTLAGDSAGVKKEGEMQVLESQPRIREEYTYRPLHRNISEYSLNLTHRESCILSKKDS